MLLNKFLIMFDMTDGNSMGGGTMTLGGGMGTGSLEEGGFTETETPDMSTQDTNLDLNENMDNGQAEMEDVNNNEIGEGEFDPTTLNLSQEEMIASFDPAPYEFLRAEGFNIDSPDMAMFCAEMAELGVHDPQVQANFLRKMQAERQAEFRTPAQIKANLIQNLSPQAKANYQSVASVVKMALRGTEFQDVWQGVMQEPAYVEVINSIVTHLRGGARPNNSTVVNQPMSNGRTADKAYEEYVNMYAEARRKDNFTETTRNDIIKKIKQGMSRQELQKLQENYGL